MNTLSIRLLVVVLLIATGCAEHASLQTTFERAIEEFDLPDSPGGAVLVYQGDSVLLRRAFGLAEVESGRQNTPETCFRLASVTKQFTAMCVLILADRGELQVTQPMSDFFADFPPAAAQVTVHELLSHTSGIVAYEEVMAETTTVPVLDADVFRLLQTVDSTYFPPGSNYRYSNSGYALLALIVEKVSGMGFAEFLSKEIFLPLGMKSSIAIEHGLTDAAIRAFGYSPPDSGQTEFQRTDQSTTSHVLGDGGIYSCVDDLLRWHLSLLDRPLVSREILEDAFAVQAMSEDGTTRYGYGWMIGEIGGLKTVFHSGSTIGFRNFLLRVPERGLLVVVLMNRNDGPAETIARRLAEAALAQ